MKNIRFLALFMIIVMILGLTFCADVNRFEDNEKDPVSEESLFSTLSAEQTKRLSGLAKVWGFLKYYHPEVTLGKRDWDRVLLDAIPRVKGAQNAEEFNRIVEEIISEAGNPNSLNPGTVPEAFSWMQDETLFTTSIRDTLATFLNTDQVPTQYYVGTSNNVGNTTYGNEKDYDVFYYPNEKYRLLALFRYWNIIDYFFPYKGDMDRNWSDVLEEYIPRIAAAKDESEYHMAMKEMTVNINDSHGFFYSSVKEKFFGNYYAWFYVEYIEKQTVVTRVTSVKIDLQVGDIILKYGDTDIEEFRAQMHKYIEGSNEPTIQRNINYLIRRGHGDQLKYTILRDGETKEVSVDAVMPTGRFQHLRAEKVPSNNTEKWKILDGTNIGYVDLAHLTEAEVPTVMSDLKETDAIIFDVRNYPDTFLVYTIPPYLNPGKTAFVKFTEPDLTRPGEFEWTSLFYCSQEENSDYYKGKVVILCNETTQSMAEFTVMALQTAPKSTIIGSQTAGADGNVSYVKLPGNIKTYFTGIGVYYPDGTPTQRIGIVPDIEVRPTVAGIKAGKDEVLERAIKFIEKGK